ncbi:MAG: hypothetical protein E6G97_18205 [Alphaproteobacteria bacterium]|nr:MAG: hypothetical protein E6G97_18205 [Alphaproteobacteria bacterium]
MKRRPVVTREILEGLCQAYGRMEADDLSDLTDEQQAAFEAAGRWVSKMWEFMPPSERREEEAEALLDQQRASGPIQEAQERMANRIKEIQAEKNRQGPYHWEA